ncbi:putative ribonuclease H protein [Glycine soja]
MDSSGIYSTRTAYKFLLGEMRGESEDGTFSLLWRLKIPPKAKVFTWRLIKDHLPTNMNLRGRQVEIADPLCPFYNNLDEDAAHLFFNCSKYADDTVFVGEAVWDNIHAIKAILRGFELASGLKINFAKSQFWVIGDGVNWAREAANNLNCQQLECPFLYLGIPIGANPSSQLVWEPIITKFKSKLVKWAQKNISMAGKVTLINYVLNALPIYLLSFFKIPQKVVKKLISLQRNFLWGGDIDQKKIPWVKWTDLCLPKADGGLGIKDISKFNSALMGRWLWAFASDQQQLWARVITSKYGGWSDLQNARDKRGYSHWWRDIRNLYHQLDCSIFKDNLSWKVGCGENIKFWTDNWLGEQYSLQQKYYQLFLISRQQRDLISQEEENFLCTLVDSKKNLMPNMKDLIQKKAGLGIKDIETFNLALLGKWKWQLMQENGELWTRVLKSKYGGWRNLEEIGNSAKQSGMVIQNNMRWKVGDGEKIRFWKHKWINQQESLAERYPRLFIISSQQNHNIRTYLNRYVADTNSTKTNSTMWLQSRKRSPVCDKDELRAEGEIRRMPWES